MPYEVHWYERSPRIVGVRLIDPIGEDEIDAIEQEYLPLVEDGQPAYLLVDLRQIDVMRVFTSLAGRLLNSPALSALSNDQMRQSRVALLGGGAIVNLILGMAGDGPDEQELLRAFGREDRALDWLREQASLLAPPSPDPAVP